MSHGNPECLACCKGAPPYFLCRDKRCICHLELDLMAQKKHKASGHRDPTATTAIGNISKEQRNKK